MSTNDNAILMNYMLTALFQKVTVPADYHSQVKVVKGMLEDDVSGLVDSLLDFAVDSASVDYSIETDNETLTELFTKWFDRINKDALGIPTGINPLAEEYFKERWKSSSFPILKMGKWKNIGSGFLVPTQMFFVDGESIHATEKNPNSENLKLVNYDYKLGITDKAESLNKNVIITKPYARWTDKYPTPYLIKRGVYHNWKIISSIKGKELEVLDRIIPYMLLIKKGTERLAIDKNIHYTDKKLQTVIDQFETALNNYKELDTKIKMPIRATNFDEKLEHLIPDLSSIFKPELFQNAEKNILAGLGFVDIAEAISSSRRESVLNPKPFIHETKKGVKDFKQLLKEVLLTVMDVNKGHIKFKAKKIRVVSSPVIGFMTDKFKERIRQLWDRGKLSNKTAVEIIGEVDFEIEVKRREQEAKDGIDITMYPNLTENKEGISIDLPGQKPSKVDKDEIPDSKTGPERNNFKASLEMSDEDHLEGAPYSIIKDLPARVKKNLNIDLQRVFLRVFNRAYNTYQNDSLAFRTAWSVIRQIAKKGKDGQWIRKSKKVKGKSKPVRLTKSIIERAIEQSEEDFIKEAFEMKNLSMSESKKELLAKLTLKKVKVSSKQNSGHVKISDLLDQVIKEEKEKSNASSN